MPGSMNPRVVAWPMVGGGTDLNPSIRWSGTRVLCSIAMMMLPFCVSDVLRAGHPDRLNPEARRPERRPDEPVVRADERRRDGPPLGVAVAVAADALRRRLGVVAEHAQQVGHADHPPALVHDLGGAVVP